MNELMTVEEVAKRLKVSTRTLYRLIEEKKFPPGVKYSNKMVRWPNGFVEQWLERQQAIAQEQMLGERLPSSCDASGSSLPSLSINTDA